MYLNIERISLLEGQYTYKIHIISCSIQKKQHILACYDETFREYVYIQDSCIQVFNVVQTAITQTRVNKNEPE